MKTKTGGRSIHEDAHFYFWPLSSEKFLHVMLHFVVNNGEIKDPATWTYYILIDSCNCQTCPGFLINNMTPQKKSMEMLWGVHGMNPAKPHKTPIETSLVVQWLRLHVPMSLGSISGRGTRSHILQLKDSMCTVEMEDPSRLSSLC